MTRQSPGTPSPAADAAELLAEVVRQLLPAQAEMEMRWAHQDDSALLTLIVKEGDLPALHGPGGRTVRSLRSFVASLGARSGTRLMLDIQSFEE